MKFFKTILISLFLVFALGSGVMAETSTPPTSYITADGTPSTGPIDWATNSQITSTQATLTPGTSNNWYWAGNNSTNTSVTISSLQFAQDKTGEVNIIVGPNGKGGTPAMIVTNGLEIPEGVIVNIYGANSNNAACYITFNSKAQGDPEQTAQPGITVDGTLNVISGGINGKGSQTPAGVGVLINKTVEVYPYGEFQGTSFNNETAGISIAQNGELLANGGTIYSYQNNVAEDNSAVGAPIQGTITPNGSTILTSSPYPNYNLGTNQGCVWVVTDSTQGLMNGTAYGVASFTSNGYTFGFGPNESLTVESGATLTMNTDLEIGSTNSIPAGQNAPTLSIKTGGTLIIPSTIDLTMGENSTLTNNGTITVEPMTPPAS